MGGKGLKLEWLLAELASNRACAFELQAIFKPDREHGIDQVVHHVLRVVRGGGHTQQLLSARHCRVVDGLDVDGVLVH